MKYHVCTTMNAAGWEQTGRRMAESFVKRWPQEAMPLTIYAEGFDPETLPGITVKRLPAWLGYFKEVYHGHNGKSRNGYNYTRDAVKFAHKVAAVTDFGESLNDGVMIWLDADTFTHAEVTVDWLDGLFPEPSYIAWLDRTGTHPECGFVMYRCAHARHASIMKAYRELYTSGRLFKLKRWDDCTALETIIMFKASLGKIEAPVSLSGPDAQWHHPFVNGPLGARLDHLKGPRKAEGRSRRLDSRVARTEPYWT